MSRSTCRTVTSERPFDSRKCWALTTMAYRRYPSHMEVIAQVPDSAVSLNCMAIGPTIEAGHVTVRAALGLRGDDE